MNIYINGRFLTKPITGVQRYAHELVKAIDELIGKEEYKNFRFTILTPRRINTKLKLTNIPLRKVGYLSGHLWEQCDLPRYCGKDLLFCPGNTVPLISLLFKRPLVVTIHSLSYLYCPETYNFFFRFFYKAVIPPILHLSNAIITPSLSERETIISRYSYAANRLHTIQNGTLPLPASETSGTSINRAINFSQPFILYVGSFSKSKNIKGVLRAMAIVTKKIDVHLVIAGVREKIFKDPHLDIPDELASKIHFVGHVSDVSDLVYLYKKAACLIFPSFYESSGLPPTEAMMLGCPVIVSLIPALKERCGDAAYYVNPYSVESIAEGMYKVLTDETLRQDLIQKGLERAKLFSWEKSAKEHIKIFEEVLKS